MLLQIFLQADTDFTSLYYSVQLLCYAFSGITGLIGAIRIYSLWNIHGRHHVHIDSQLVAWVGAAIFFLCASFFINALLL